MTIFLTIIAAILIFALLIFIHELGHFIMAKATGIRVLEFALGMGPKLVKFQKGETLYSIRAFPIGGFCAMEGEDTNSDDPHALNNKPAWARLLVLVAGAFMNILLGFVLLCLMIGSQPQVATTVVGNVENGSAAYEAGLRTGDEIRKIDGARTHLYDDIMWETAGKNGEETNFTVRRDGEELDIPIRPRESGGKYVYGFSGSAADNSFGLTVKNAYYGTFFYSKLIIESLFDLITGEVKITQLSGPIGIVSEIGSAVQEAVKPGGVGLLQLLNLAVLLTINLGIFNLLPIPALDGGRILFVLVEIVRRKPLPPEKEGMVHMIGFAALILLSIFIAFMDVMKLWH